MRLFISLGLLFLFSAAAHAALLNTATVTITPTDDGGTGPFSLTNDFIGVVNATGNATGGLASAGNATTHVDYGIIQLQGAANGSIDSVAIGVYRDFFTINSPGIAATTAGRLTITVGIDGTMDAPAGISQAKWVLNAEVGGGSLSSLASGNLPSPAAGDFGDPFDPYGTYTANVNFQFGVPTELEVQLVGTAHARYDSATPGSANFNFGESLFWQGISLVHTIGGNALDDLSLTSDSGTNWLEPVTLPAPVPEPGALFALAVGTLWIARRKPRRNHPHDTTQFFPDRSA